MNTKYKDLSENEKRSDREEADKMLSIAESYGFDSGNECYFCGEFLEEDETFTHMHTEQNERPKIRVNSCYKCFQVEHDAETIIDMGR